MFNRWLKKHRIYLDYAAATPLGSAAARALQKAEAISYFGNPSSIHHEGRQARALLDEARKEIATILEVHEDELIFVSGGTESDNLAILGITDAYSGKGFTHAITGAIEHGAVLESFNRIKEKGFSTTLLAPDSRGYVGTETLEKALTPETLLVSVGLVNSELGTVAPIRALSGVIARYKEKLGRSKKEPPFFHTDASQAATLLSVRPHDLGVDALTLDAAKIYGPKGVGLLFVRRGLMVTSQQVGGGQERGRRAGTENVPAIVSFGAALKEAVLLRTQEHERMEVLNMYARTNIAERFPEIRFNSEALDTLPSYVNICIPAVDAEFLSVELDTRGIAVSSASACRTISGTGSSYVLKAFPQKESCASSSLRITFGRTTTQKDIDMFLDTLKELLVSKRITGQTA